MAGLGRVLGNVSQIFLDAWTHGYNGAQLLTHTAGEQKAEEQEQGSVSVQGPCPVAVYSGILAGAHLHPEVRDVRHGWFP